MGVATALRKAWPVAAAGADHPAIERLMQGAYGSGLLCGTLNSIISPGLMDGLAGIGLGALGIIHPDAIPSVLTLEGVPRARDPEASAPLHARLSDSAQALVLIAHALAAPLPSMCTRIPAQFGLPPAHAQSIDKRSIAGKEIEPRPLLFPKREPSLPLDA